MRALALLLILLAPALRAAEPARSEVILPLKDYLSLVEQGDAAEKERQRREASREAPVAEVVSQQVRVSLGQEDVAEVAARYEVLVQGQPKEPVVLPVTGVPQEAGVDSPGAALSAGARAGEWLLVAPAAGRYTAQISGPVPLPPAGGVSRLTLAPAAAPVSLTEIELPADLAWSAPGTVVVEDRVEGARRTVRLTARRGQAQTVEVRRKLDGGDAEKLLAQSLVLTLIQLRPDGPRRHDVVLYEVSRGSLGSFTVDLPPGLAVETVGTDEGEVVPTVESRRLTVQRRQQLRGVGYLVLTSTPRAGAELALDPVVPEGTVRERYVALASSVAADVKPLPEASWARVDLDDLPPALREALNGIDLAAAWRLAGSASSPDLRMAVSPLPSAPSLPVVASLRETTTLITLDGTLLHRDQITLRPGAIGTALDLTLPAAATLWSAKVDGVPVRPLERGSGRISVPLGFDTGKDAVVEVISVQEKAIPKGRSELALDLPRLAVPVQEHRWRLLLPDGAEYRYRAGDLRPAVTSRPAEKRRRGWGGGGGSVKPLLMDLEKIPTTRDPWALLQTTPGVLTDRINVGGNESGQQAYVGPGTAAVLRGIVADEQGAPLAGVTVTISSHGGKPLVKESNAQGLFLFDGLAAGSYEMKAELEGFSTIDYPGISLGVGHTSTVEVRLAPAVEDVITVTAESPMLDERQLGNTQTYRTDESTGGGWSPRRKAAPPPKAPTYVDFDAFQEETKSLKRGLVGGVKPLPIAIPETGKLLLLSGVLPPEKIGVELEVKGKK